MIKLLDEAYLDDNEEFYDYETQDNADVDKKIYLILPPKKHLMVDSSWILNLQTI